MTSGIPKGKKKRTDEERREERKARDKKYQQSEKGKAKRKEHQQSEVVKARRKKYRSSEKGKAKSKEYRASKNFKAVQKKYSSSEKGKAKSKERYLGEKGHPALRLKILQHYSKHLSNSDIPCCRCCGLNSHNQFLAIDHAQGRYKMDSIPELTNLGYSSKKTGDPLLRWIIKNNFPKGFQILCHSCNVAKRDDGHCPMENKPH